MIHIICEARIEANLRKENIRMDTDGLNGIDFARRDYEFDFNARSRFQ